MKRIVLTGAESTGKSTLAQALASHYEAPVVEYVRQYVNHLGRKLAEDLEPIARGQLALEHDAASRATGRVLHDTNILSSILYAQHYFATHLDWLSCLPPSYSLYLLCLPDIPWQPDPGQRDSAHARDELHRIFKAALDVRQLHYVEIGGDPATRLQHAIQAINALP